MKLVTFFSITILFLSGCSVANAPPPNEKTQEPGVIDYFTGAEHIKILNKTKSKLEDINKTMQEKYEGMMNEDK